MDSIKREDIEKTIAALKRNGYSVSFFDTKEDAARYLNSKIDNNTVGFGDSQTLHAMGLYDMLVTHNDVRDPFQSKDNDEFIEIAKNCLVTDVFLTSVNGLSMTGEMVNIDGTGNRVAGSLFSHKTVFFVTGVNKIEPTLEKAIWRARNIAAPLNCKKYDFSTPCVKGGKCFDCSNPERICNALVIYLKKVKDVEDAEVVLINEKLGY